MTRDDGRMPATRVPAETLARIDTLLDGVDATLAARYPGDRGGSQPVHTVYLSAAAAGPATVIEWGADALELLDRHPAVFDELGDATTLAMVRERLRTAPIADLRLDFEDGYGRRADDIEDADALQAGDTLRALGLGSCGVRIKGLTAADRHRSVRTLELVLDGGVPEGFVFTVPKLRAAEQVTATVWLCEALEDAFDLPPRSLSFELQIESPQAVLGSDGAATVARAIELADGRCSGLHYGTYDYSAACGIAPQQQALDHPVADHAKAVMQIAAAQTGVWIADGSTQVFPTGTDDQVTQAIRRHHRLVTRSLERGYYQGWDMHPGHLVTRWLATFTYFRVALTAAAPRLQAYLDRRGGAIVDEPATAEALATVVLRGLDCGAFDVDDVANLAPAATISVLRNLKDRKPV